MLYHIFAYVQIYIYIYISVPTIYQPKPCKALAQVAELMSEHMKGIRPEDQRPVPDQGLLFRDYGDDSSDSGLESII